MKCSTFAVEIVHLKVRDILKDYVENSNILSFFNIRVRVQTFTNTHERRKKSCPNRRENVIDVLYIFSFQRGILQFTSSLSLSLFSYCTTVEIILMVIGYYYLYYRYST